MKRFKIIAIIILLFTSSIYRIDAQTGKKNADPKNANLNNMSIPIDAPKITRNNKNEPRGIYVASDWQKPIPEYVLSSPDVDGVFLRMAWKQFQKAPDQFDWSYIDSELRRIKKAGKQASIGVACGVKCPDWIYTMGGVKSLEFSEIPNNGKGEKLFKMKLPVVWDAKYLSLWTNFITALATHLKSEPDLYAIITQVKITGLNIQTIEIRLPSEKFVTNGRDTSTDAYAIWKSAGYKPQLIKDSWHTITDCFSKNFKDKIINLAFIPKNGFPFFDDNGNEIEKTPENDFTRWLINDGCQRFGQQFAIQFNALSFKTGKSKMIANAKQLGYLSGYQIEEVHYGNPECLKTKTPCNEGEFTSVLDRGFEDGAQFIEVFVEDVLAFPQTLKYGSKKMNTAK